MPIFEMSPVNEKYFVCRKSGEFEQIQDAYPVKLPLFGKRIECALHRSLSGNGYAITEQYTGKQIAYHPCTKRMVLQEALAKLLFVEIAKPESYINELFSGNLSPRYAR